jgi:Ni/Co efflux regulator RcnB
MKRSQTIIAGLLAASFGLSSVAFAQPRHDDNNGRNGRQETRNGRNDDHDARGGDRNDGGRHYYNARTPEFRRGGRLPSELRDRGYVVNDWRGHHLSAPPRGYNWVQVGPDYVLTAIATGIIANMILSR